MITIHFGLSTLAWPSYGTIACQFSQQSTTKSVHLTKSCSFDIVLRLIRAECVSLELFFLIS